MGDGFGQPRASIETETGYGRILEPAWMQDPAEARSVWALGEPRGTGEFVPCGAQALLWMEAADNTLHTDRKTSC